METLICWIERRWLLLSASGLLLITLLSLWPAEQLPQHIPGNDKSHHFIAYMLLVLPLALRRPRYWQGGVLLFFVWSGALELIQPYVNRWGEWFDLLANGIGLLLGCVLAVLIQYSLRSR